MLPVPTNAIRRGRGVIGAHGCKTRTFALATAPRAVAPRLLHARNACCRPSSPGLAGKARMRWILLFAGLAQGCAAAPDAAPDAVVFAEDFETGGLAAWPDGVDPTRQQVMTGPAFAQSGSR